MRVFKTINANRSCRWGQAVAKHGLKLSQQAHDTRGHEAERVQESAALFSREFKTTMRDKGFSAYKYNRNGRQAARVFHLDPSNSTLFWKTKKSKDGFDNLQLCDILEVINGGDERTSKLLPPDEANRLITIVADNVQRQ